MLNVKDFEFKKNTLLGPFTLHLVQMPLNGNCKYQLDGMYEKILEMWAEFADFCGKAN